jgi:hypothetical protein
MHPSSTEPTPPRRRRYTDPDDADLLVWEAVDTIDALRRRSPAMARQAARAMRDAVREFVPPRRRPPKEEC